MIILILKAVILGIVEGVTEFLPVSSTGHLIILNQWISFSDSFTKMFDVVIQLGAILAVIVFFWSKLWPFGRGVGNGPEGKHQIFSIWKKIIIGVLPVIVIGALLGSFIEKKLFNPWIVAGALIVGGVALIFVDREQANIRFQSVSQIPWATALFIGFIQCLSMVPGTSRAAATIIGAMLLGASRVVAVEFSFYLAIPTMIAASAYSILKHGLSLSIWEVVLLLVGFMWAFVVALFVIKYFMNYIRTRDFKIFGYYRIVLGVLVVIYFLWITQLL